MGGTNIFTLDLKKEELSLIRLAIKLWSVQNVQGRVRNYFEENQTVKSWYSRSSKWDEVVDYVIEQASLLHLQPVLLGYVNNYITLIGEKIYNWNMHVRIDHGFAAKYAEKMYWTSYGTVDDLKIVEEFWLKEFELSALDEHRFLGIAALYAREDVIKKSSLRYQEKLNLLLPTYYRENNWTIYGILSAYLIFWRQRNTGDAKHGIENFKQKPNSLPAGTLFLICLQFNFRYAALYFWTNLTTKERQSLIVEAAEVCLGNNNCYPIFRFSPEFKIESLIFLMNEMSEIQVMGFVTKHFGTLFDFFKRNWPFEGLCLKMLEQKWEYNPWDVKKSLKLVISYLSNTNKRIQLRDKILDRALFEKLLLITSKDIKVELFVKKNANDFYEDFKYFDVFSFAFILNDSDLKEYRDSLLTYCEEIFKKLVFDGNYRDLSIIMDKIFSNDEKKLFKSKLNFFHFFITNGEFETGDKHLRWLYDSENDRLAAKEQIDPSEICNTYLKNVDLT